MMNSKTVKSVVAVFLAVLMAMTVLPLSVFAAATVDTQKLPDDMSLISKTDYKIAPGIEESHFIFNNDSGTRQNLAYAMTIDLGGSASIAAGYKDYNGATVGLQTVRDQARAAERKTGSNVVGAVNADIFNMANGAPSGYLVMNGVEYYHNDRSLPYFAILKDGTAVIRPAGVPTTDVKEAVGMFAIVVDHGVNVCTTGSGYDGSDQPRTCVGIKEDGSVVLLVVDGRQSPKSAGCSWAETADILISMGCVMAGNLDGGGSTTYLSKHEGSDKLVCQNSPSDGVERSVSSTLIVFSHAKPTGEFEHASLTPNNEIYTPGSTVQFNASGVDSSGGYAPLPEDGAFVLEDSSFGSIDSNGLFKSNGKIGTVSVNYVSGGAVCGNVSIEIQNPDSIFFDSDEISLGFEAETDFGLSAKYMGRDVNIKDDDIIWTAVDSSTGVDCLDVIGTFNGNVLTTADGVTITANITATYAQDLSLSASLKAIIGMLPTIVWDFEDSDYFSIDTDGSNFKTGTAGRGAVASAEIVSIYDDYPVRFGTQSLKLNYDFTVNSNGTDGSYFGRVENEEIPGTPTGIGIWVYAPEETANFWLRGYIYSGTGALMPVDFTLQTSQATADTPAGIYWSGWKYCEADLTNIQGPYTLAKGYTFRLMYVPGINMGARTKGSIYLDNLQFVYGANTDDVNEPYVSSMQINYSEIESGVTVVNDNTVTLTTRFDDVKNKYTTGVEVVRMYIDGKEVTHDASYVENFVEGFANIYDIELANGWHSLKLLVRDGFGNENTEERFFKVEGDESYPNVKFNFESSKPILCGEYSFPVVAEGNIDSVTFDLTAGNIYKDYTVEFTPAWQNSTVTYNERNNRITVNASKDSSVASDGVIANISYRIPDDLLEGTMFTCEAHGSFVSTDEVPEAFKPVFSSGNVSEEVKSLYNVKAEPIIMGTTGVIAVVDIDGNSVAGINVYYENGDLVGTTDENGEIVTDSFASEIGSYRVYAERDSMKSFIYTVSVNDIPAAINNDLPYNILSVATVNSSTDKSFTWMSNPLTTSEKAVMLLAEKSAYDQDGDKAFKEYTGSSSVLNMGVTYGAVRSSNVTATGLKTGVEYVYKVGDGNNWSEINTFTLSPKNKDTSFFIIGDIQALDLDPTKALLESLVNSDKKYDFSIQTGDSVDNAGNFNYWDAITSVYNTDVLGGLDTIHVMGNHEFEGDLGGINAGAIYNFANGGNPGSTYSVQYGNVYVAVINYTRNEAQLVNALDWLVKDAQQSDATWKVLTMHQPAYYTNTTGGNEYINRLVPAAVDEAGIDFVFSGHDHSYARTQPMTGGKVDEANGSTYFICGSTGEKAYDIVNNKAFNFACVDESFEAAYITVDTTDTSFTVTAYSRNADGSDVLIDSYTKEKATKCPLNEHSYIYDGTFLCCSECGYVRTNGLSGYTGLVKDTNGHIMYAFLGSFRTNIWVNNDNDYYYFNEKGYALTGKAKVTEALTTAKPDSVSDVLYGGKPVTIEYTFSADGKLQRGSVIDKNNSKYYVYAGVIQTGWFNIDGSLYYFDGVKKADYYGKMLTGNWTRDYRRYECNSKGQLVKGFVYRDVGGTKYLWGDDFASGWVDVNGLDWGNNSLKGRYYFDPVSNYMVTDSAVINGVTYYFNNDGSLKDGKEVTSQGTRIYNKGALKTGWVNDGGVDRYFDPANNGYMAVDTAVIDGEIYAFDGNGIFVHKGEHNRTFVKHVDVSCTADGYDLYKCTVDGNVYEEYGKIYPAKGHVDKDDNGKCDVCGTNLLTFLQRIIRFFEKLLNQLSKIFS